MLPSSPLRIRTTQKASAATLALFAAVGAAMTCLAPSASAIVYNRTAAVTYANNYWNKVVTDGYFWINGSTYNYYGSGAAVPVNAPNEASGIGDDCAHFVSSAVGSPGGGLSIASRVPPTYGEPGAARLDQLLISNGYAQQVSSVSQLTPGDVIGYDWTGSGHGSMGGIDHTVLYLGNNKVASHAASYIDTWDSGNSSSTITFFIHFTLHDSIVPTAPKNTSPAANSSLASLTPTLYANPFSCGAIGSTHIASQWQLFSQSTLLYDTGASAANLLSLTLPPGKLAPANTYSWQVRYEDNYGDWSPYSTATTFSTLALPEPTAALLLFAPLLLSRRRRSIAPAASRQS